MTILDLAMARISGLKRKTASEWAGPCPECGGTDRFLVWPNKGVWYCRGCELSGDAVAFLRRFDGLGCKEAHERAGKDCQSVSCQAREKCHGVARPVRRTERLQAPVEVKTGDFHPVAAQNPSQTWAAKAAALVDYAHQALLGNAEQLMYLAGRGLDGAAVARYRLGWLDQDLYRERAAWGLDEQLKGDGTPKKLWLPRGVVIPFFDAQGQVERIRIRRPQVSGNEPRYYWVPGSGDNVPVIGGERGAYVVVESDLDALLVHHLAGDLAGAVPLGTCSAKPKAEAFAQLQQALCILVALDFEPRVNATTGRNENPGGKAAEWWCRTFEQAKRWPVPAGKDPGEFFETGGDVRAWVVAGLPAVFRLEAPPQPVAEASESASLNEMNENTSGVVLLRGISRKGIEYAVVPGRADLAAGALEAPGCALFTAAEIEQCKGMSAEEADAVMAAKVVFPGAMVLRREVAA
jgi:hypothetical protein